MVMVKDKFGGIQKGTVFTRNIDMNEGARRVDLDQMYSKVDLRLSHKVIECKVADDSAEVKLNFFLSNNGRMAATFVVVSLQFSNIVRIKNHGRWADITSLRNNPAVELNLDVVHLTERVVTSSIILEVNKDIKEIEAFTQLYSMNMLTKKYTHVISLES